MGKAFGRRWRLLALAAGAVLAVSVGVAYAAIPGSNGVISGCYVSGNGQLRVIDAEGGDTCKNNETALDWNQTGPAGPQGEQGEKGDKGDPDEEYGVASVKVSRGGAAPTVWARYSTELGSPVGDTTGGTFRFTCTAAQAPCKVSVAAAALSDSSVAPAGFYPRVLLYRGGDPDSAITPEFYCEYGDGPPQALARQPLSSDPSAGPALLVHIGGSADCNGPVPTAGAVTEIVVPKGYYDVFSTFVFQQ